ncbi:POK19 protein, partial [Indicator maculatus]|nr:POK19 protein [Indicator maculatus]
AFSIAGVPHQIKTDNGPVYLSGRVNSFLQLWDVTHVTGIPHSPTAQAIIECVHGT